MMKNNPFQYLIDEFGEDDTKIYLRDFFRNPDNLPLFATLFSGHVPSYPPDFHVELLEQYTGSTGNVGGAAPRGFAKSTITSLVYLAWRSIYATSRFSILISDTYTQAVDLMAGLKDEIEENEFIQWLYGEMIGSSWAEDDIEIIGYGEHKRLQVRIIALGAGMKVRGRKFKNFRPQLVIIDDLENDEAVASKERRAKLRRWLVRAVMPAVDRTVGRIILIGTILHKRSLLNAIINNEEEFAGWTTFHYAAIKEDGSSLWPEVYTVEKLIAMRDDPKDPDYYGAIAFAQEMMNKPIDEGMQIIKDEWVQPYNLAALIEHFSPLVAPEADLLGEWLKYHFKSIVASIDPAISEKETADYWAMVTVGITKQCPICEGKPEGHILILDYERVRESDPLKQIDIGIDSYLLWQHDKIRLEVVAYQAALAKLMKREAAKRNLHLPLRPFRPLVSKVRRLNVQAANFSGGLVHVRQDHPLYQVFKDELLEFPQGENDDMVDAYLSAAEGSLRRTGKPQTAEAD